MRDRLSTTVKALYETDFVAWTHQTAELVRKGRLGEIDLEVLAEEIEDLGKSERSAIRSHLTRMMMHLIKQRIQPERNSASWRTSIIDARMQILAKIEDSPRLAARGASRKNAKSAPQAVDSAFTFGEQMTYTTDC
jgi:hypothetical protein